MDSSPGSLSPFQWRVLRAFFERERAFFLTGGAALAGFHLGHRTTGDLDLFSVDDEGFERGPHVMGAVADAIGAELLVRQDAPGFKRFALLLDGDVLVVDLVRERTRQLHADKLERDGIRIDAADEILANKLTALVGRAEERDLVDVMFLEREGHRVDDALGPALAKDGGCTPATLAWLLSEVQISDTAPLPAGVEPKVLRDYVAELVVRLRRLAVP